MRENSTFTKGAMISVVDDDESIREAIEALIGSMGLSVRVSQKEDLGRQQHYRHRLQI
jgi:FixJ family two-component response regulator